MVRTDAPAYAFDQDLAPYALDQRRLELAQHLERCAPIPLPYAYDLVARLAVTRDFLRARPRILEVTTFFRVLGAQERWWYVDLETAERQHPLVPEGFALCRATQLAEMARVVLSGEHELPEDYTMSAVLMAVQALRAPFERLSAHLFVQSTQMLFVEPVPFAHMLPRAYRLRLRDLVNLRHLGAGDDREEWSERLSLARDQYIRLTQAARLSSAVARKFAQPLDVRARDALGVPWCWPLACRLGQDRRAAEFEARARRECAM